MQIFKYYVHLQKSSTKPKIIFFYKLERKIKTILTLRRARGIFPYIL